MSVLTRYAPTPSGHLHLGNILNFALCAAYAKQHRGRIALRIDDLDASRARPEFVENIFDTLSALDFRWDVGPKNSADFFQNFSQASRQDRYFKAIKGLPTYACDCSRSMIQARTTLAYDGHCRVRKLPFFPGKNALRLQWQEFPDLLLWSKDNHPTYPLVSVIDDVSMGVNVIIRGEDLREITAVQKALASAMGLRAFAQIQFGFHALLLDRQSKKLSKSQGAESVSMHAADVFPQLSENLAWGCRHQNLTDFISDSRALELIK